jgi:hypothetical protein
MNTNPKLPPLHDLVRAYDTTDDGTVRRLLAYYEQPPGQFTYMPARQVAPAAFSHGVARSQIQKAVASRGSPAGRGQNLEVADHLWDAGNGRSVSCYPLTHRHFPIRRDLSIRVPADFLVVEDRLPHVFWFQPRRTFALTQLGLGVIGTIFRMTFLVDDLANAGVELLDLSAMGATRQHVRYRLPDLPTVSDAEVTAVLQRLVRAYDTICGMDRDWDADAKSRRERRLPPTIGPGLFG